MKYHTENRNERIEEQIELFLKELVGTFPEWSSLHMKNVLLIDGGSNVCEESFPALSESLQLVSQFSISISSS